LNDEIKKKLKNKEIAIKRIRTLFEKNKIIERTNKNLELNSKIEKKIQINK